MRSFYQVKATTVVLTMVGAPLDTLKNFSGSTVARASPFNLFLGSLLLVHLLKLGKTSQSQGSIAQIWRSSSGVDQGQPTQHQREGEQEEAKARKPYQNGTKGLWKGSFLASQLPVPSLLSLLFTDNPTLTIIHSSAFSVNPQTAFSLLCSLYHLLKSEQTLPTHSPHSLHTFEQQPTSFLLALLASPDFLPASQNHKTQFNLTPKKTPTSKSSWVPLHNWLSSSLLSVILRSPIPCRCLDLILSAFYCVFTFDLMSKSPKTRGQRKYYG
ncbi:hypothetical protein E2320_012247 [Naja naja]|nr:hypothetical protein E2320_012247 [Naja naja]